VWGGGGEADAEFAVVEGGGIEEVGGSRVAGGGEAGELDFEGAAFADGGAAVGNLEGGVAALLADGKDDAFVRFEVGTGDGDAGAGVGPGGDLESGRATGVGVGGSPRLVICTARAASTGPRMRIRCIGVGLAAGAAGRACGALVAVR
jgi:hypothetical protein